MTNPFVEKANNPFLAKKKKSGKKVKITWQHAYGESTHTGRVEYEDKDHLHVRNSQGVVMKLFKRMKHQLEVL